MDFNKEIGWRLEAGGWVAAGLKLEVGRLEAGWAGLETMRFGEWRSCPHPRGALFLAFPRAVGNVARPLWAAPPSAIFSR